MFYLIEIHDSNYSQPCIIAARETYEDAYQHGIELCNQRIAKGKAVDWWKIERVFR
jgi:hypothetical protein